LPTLRDAQDHRGPPRTCIHQARHRATSPAVEISRRDKNQGAYPLAKHRVLRDLPPTLHNPQEDRMTMTAREAFERGTATFNAHHLDGFAEVLADQVVFKAPGGMQGEGKVACAAFFGSWFTSFPDARVKVKAVYIVDDVAVEEGTFMGTHNGVLHGPMGD